MTPEILCFFEGHPGALPIFCRLEELLAQCLPETAYKVTKTQITLTNRRGFGAISFAPVRKAKDRPKDYLTLTFGLSYQKISPRIDVATEPYPNRWTHHILLSRPEELDGEVMAWLAEAAAFSATKR